MTQPDELGGLDKKGRPSYLSDLAPLTMSKLGTIIYDLYEQSSASPSKYIRDDNMHKRPDPEEAKKQIKELILKLQAKEFSKIRIAYSRINPPNPKGAMELTEEAKLYNRLSEDLYKFLDRAEKQFKKKVDSL